MSQLQSKNDFVDSTGAFFFFQNKPVIYSPANDITKSFISNECINVFMSECKVYSHKFKLISKSL